jgi:hypothetical protein
MGGHPEYVKCCFCGTQVLFDEAVYISAYTAEMEDERQNFFADKECFAKAIIPEIPLHPGLLVDPEIRF